MLVNVKIQPAQVLHLEQYELNKEKWKWYIFSHSIYLHFSINFSILFIIFFFLLLFFDNCNYNFRGSMHWEAAYKIEILTIDSTLNSTSAKKTCHETRTAGKLRGTNSVQVNWRILITPSLYVSLALVKCNNSFSVRDMFIKFWHQDW